MAEGGMTDVEFRCDDAPGADDSIGSLRVCFDENSTAGDGDAEQTFRHQVVQQLSNGEPGPLRSFASASGGGDDANGRHDNRSHPSSLGSDFVLLDQEAEDAQIDWEVAKEMMSIDEAVQRIRLLNSSNAQLSRTVFDLNALLGAERLKCESWKKRCLCSQLQLKDIHAKSKSKFELLETSRKKLKLENQQLKGHPALRHQQAVDQASSASMSPVQSVDPPQRDTASNDEPCTTEAVERVTSTLDVPVTRTHGKKTSPMPGILSQNGSIADSTMREDSEADIPNAPVSLDFTFDDEVAVIPSAPLNTNPEDVCLQLLSTGDAVAKPAPYQAFRNMDNTMDDGEDDDSDDGDKVGRDQNDGGTASSGMSQEHPGAAKDIKMRDRTTQLLSTQTAEPTDMRSKLTAAIEELRKKQEESEAQLKCKNEELEVTIKELDELRTRTSQAEKDWSERKSALEKDLTNVSEANKDLSGECDDYRAKVTGMTEALAKAEDDLYNQREANNGLKEQHLQMLGFVQALEVDMGHSILQEAGTPGVSGERLEAIRKQMTRDVEKKTEAVNKVYQLQGEVSKLKQQPSKQVDSLKMMVTNLEAALKSERRASARQVISYNQLKASYDAQVLAKVKLSQENEQLQQQLKTAVPKDKSEGYIDMLLQNEEVVRSKEVYIKKLQQQLRTLQEQNDQISLYRLQADTFQKDFATERTERVKANDMNTKLKEELNNMAMQKQQVTDELEQRMSVAALNSMQARAGISPGAAGNSLYSNPSPHGLYHQHSVPAGNRPPPQLPARNASTPHGKTRDSYLRGGTVRPGDGQVGHTAVAPGAGAGIGPAVGGALGGAVGGHTRTNSGSDVLPPLPRRSRPYSGQGYTANPYASSVPTTPENLEGSGTYGQVQRGIAPPGLQALIHDAPPGCECPVCGKDFPDAESVQAHVDECLTK